MKKSYIFVLLFAASFASSTFAAPRSEIYLVDTMECDGTRTTDNGLGDRLNKISMYFTSMKSTRQDGSLADALVIEVTGWSELYTSPLYVRNNRIRKSTGAYDGMIDLQIVSTETKNEVRTDTLTGTFSEEGTVVGDTNFDLKCTANVVQEVSRIDDMTNGSWLSVLPKNSELSRKIVEADKEGAVSEFERSGEYKAKSLKGDAKKVYNKADRDARYVDTINVESLSVTLIHISDAPEGNGCEYLFNLEGEYLNRICFTESGDSTEWHEK